MWSRDPLQAYRHNEHTYVQYRLLARLLLRCSLCALHPGLNDTVFDVDDDKERAARMGLEPNGFSFEGADEEGLDYGLNR